jgi:hypothetical protein
MLGASKPLASLSSGLLARKGQARPAMRPQGFANLASLASAGNDLGWNDMGHPAPVEAVPPVLVEREALAEAVETVAAPEPAEIVPPPALVDVSVATANRLRRETRHKAKAAFTLRLDEGRHLRLRLASASRLRSAQQLVTEALDAFLASMPEVDALVAQLPTAKKR